MVPTFGPSGRVTGEAASASAVRRLDELVLPTLTELYDVATLQRDVLSSEGNFLVLGERLTWNPEREDEGFFISLLGAESRCTAVSDGTTPNRAILHCTQPFDSSGLEVELFFRTRMGGETLRVVKYPNPLTTLAEGSEP